MSKKVFIGVGHGGSDPGAVANGLRESDVNLVMGCTMKVELERHGVNVGISRTGDENDPLYQEVQECNAFAPDVAVECHNNAGGGKGFEAFQQQTGAFAAQSLKLAQAIERQVKAMGQTSRGIKGEKAPAGYTFGWLSGCKCPAVLCEGAFLDNATDVKMINTITKQEAFGVAYAKGVLEYFGIEWKAVTSQQEAATIMHGVMKQVIALSDADAAKKFAAEMQNQEPNAYWFVVEKNIT